MSQYPDNTPGPDAQPPSNPWNPQAQGQSPAPWPPADPAQARRGYGQAPPPPPGGFPPPQWPPAQQQPPASPPPAPKASSTRRKVLIGAGIAAPVATIAAVAAVRMGGSGSGTAGAEGGGGSDPGNTGGLPTAAGVGSITTATLEPILAQLNRALKTRDRGSFTAPFADGQTRADAGIMFDNIGMIDFTVLQYQIVGQGGRAFPSGDGSSVAMDIALVHQIKDIDAAPVAEWYRWTLTQADDSAPVVISGVTGSPSINASAKYVYFPQVWDAKEHITVFKRANAVIVGATDHDTAVIRQFNLPDIVETAVRNNREGLAQGGGKPGYAPGALVIGTSTSDAFLYWFSGAANKQLINEAGLTTPMISEASLASENTPTSIGASRITIDLTSGYFTDNQGEDSVLSLVQHEDAHNLVFPEMSAAEYSIPDWEIEGFADFMGTRTQGNAASYFRLPNVKAFVSGQLGIPWDGGFPSNAVVYNPDGAVNNAGYGMSALVYYYIDEHYGMKGVMAFVQASYYAAANGSVNGTDNLDTACQQSLGIGIADLQTRWQGYVHQLTGA